MSICSGVRFLLSIFVTLVILSLNLHTVPAQTDSGSSLFYTGEKDYPPMPQGTAVAELSPGDTAVTLTPLPITALATNRTPISLQISTLPEEEAYHLTPLGFAFELTTDARAGDSIQLKLDYTKIPLPFGGSIHERLTLRRVVPCIEDNNSPDCVDFQSVSVQNDLAKQQLIIDLNEPDQLNSTTYILASQTTGSQSTYSLTPFSVVNDYQVDLNSGHFTTSYTIPVPPARAGAAPNVALNYNSGVIDGMHTHKNNQPGNIGIGWSLGVGTITRHLMTCVGTGATGDHCFTGENYSIILNGVSSRLVNESGNVYRLQNDPHWKVEMLTSTAPEHPDTDKEYWLVTTPDGTQYRFGGEIVPETGADQNSVFYTTIHDSGSTCGSFTYDLCDKAWQWNLDRVEDTHGNVTNYFYEVETNHYNGRGNSSSSYRREYIRAGQLQRIEYSTKSGQSEAPQARVLFNTEMRCTNPTVTAGCNWDADFPDTPGALACTATSICSQDSPTYWTQRRVGSVQTQVYDTTNSRWQMVGHYNLDQGFPIPPTDSQGDASEPKMWLGGISQHPGGDFSQWAFIQHEAENYDGQSGITTGTAEDIGQGDYAGATAADDYLLFKAINFDAGATHLIARVAADGNGRSIELHLDSPTGNLISTIALPNTGDDQSWQSVDATVTGASGIHDLYLVFKGGSANLNWFRISPHFGSGSPHPGLPAVVYDYEMLTNRRNYLGIAGDGVSPMYMPRIDQVTTELGGVVNITYDQTHPCPTTPNPTNHMPYDCFMAWDGNPDDPQWGGWVVWKKYKVTQRQTSDSFSGNPTQTLTYDYSTPQWHYTNNPALPEADECGPPGPYPYPCGTNHWRDYRGSKIVTVTDDSGAQTEYRFYTGMDDDRDNVFGGNYNASITLSDGSIRTDSNWLAGQLAETRRLDSGDNALTKTVNWFTATNNAGSGIYAAYFVAPQKMEETLYGTVDKTTQAEYEYDSYGNLTREILHGDLATTADDRNIESSYVYNTSAYIVDRPQWTKLWAGTTSGISGDERALTQFAYDFQGIGFPPTVGNLTLERAFSQQLPTAVTHDTAINYDGLGRPVSITDANNHTTTTSYHSFYGYPQTVTNALNHTTTTVMDPGWGVVTQVTDANNKTTTVEYDDYGRLTHVWLPTEPTNGPASLEYNYYPGSRPAYAHSRQLRDAGSSAYIESWSYVDGFGKELQSQRISENSGQRVVSSQQVNNLGQLRHSSAAYEIGGTAGSGYVQPTWNSLDSYHRYSYDDLGRQTTDEMMNAGTTLWSTTASYDGWLTSLFDANVHQTDQLSDAFGQLVEVTEYNDEGIGQVTFTTSYNYDLQGNLTTVTDDTGNVTDITYDLLGRKTMMADPDMGDWAYQYDPVGNLIAQRDSRDLWLHLTYDDLNRLTAKRRDTNNGPLVSEYLYDSAYNGQLDATKAYDSSGSTVEVETQILGRDGRYRVTQQQWLIAGEGSFRMAYGYDAANNQTSIQYPADNSGNLGETVTQSYNNIGQLDQVISQLDNTHFLDAISYTPTGQLSTLRLDQGANGANFAYTYQPGSLRLQQKQVSSASGGSADLQNLSYTYDDAGNISTITDGINGNQTQTFGYDWLNRLTSASTNASGTGQYNQTYSYDSIGNITEFDGAAYTYDNDQPHAVTAAHGNQYCYDGNANQVSRLIDGTLYSLTYDVENRLTGVSQVTNLIATIAKSGNDVQLSWSPIVSATSYEIWRSTKPYFTPGDNDSEMIAEISVTTHTDPNHIGDVETNYFYQVIATNGGCPIAVSQQMGEFDFGIFPGTTLLKVPVVKTEIAFPEIVDAVQMSLNVTAIAEFVYDADGNRVKGTVNGVTTIYIAGIFEYQSGAITKYYPGAGGSSAMRRENYATGNGIFYVLGDHLGSTSTIIQQNTTIMKQEYYYPFGGNRGSAFSDITTKRFTGQYHEAGLSGSEGLSFYNARWYDAQLGRFVSADTIVPSPTNPQSLNRLSYVGNNPLRFIDPTGHRECEGMGNCAPPPRPRPPHSSSSNSGATSRPSTSRNPWQIDRNGDGRISIREEMRAMRYRQYADRILLNSMVMPADSEFNAFGGRMTSNNCGTAGRPPCDARHPSADSSTGEANRGDPIYAVAFGTVVKTDYADDGFGNFIVVEHDIYGIKLYSVYAHNGLNLVVEGDIVDAGTQIAEMGSTHEQDIVHLHFEVRRATNIDLSQPNPFSNQVYWPATATELNNNFVDLGPRFGYSATYFGWAETNP